MSNTRPAIPNPLQRDLMLESGYRCAICQATEPLQIEHIKEWSKVKKHEFENMIVLCSNCHGKKKKTSDPRHINMASLKRIKADLMMLNGRYSDLEKRIIRVFSNALLEHPDIMPALMLPTTIYWLIYYLEADNIVNVKNYPCGLISRASDGTTIANDQIKVTLTKTGKSFIENLALGNVQKYRH